MKHSAEQTEKGSYSSQQIIDTPVNVLNIYYYRHKYMKYLSQQKTKEEKTETVMQKGWVLARL